MTPRRPLRVCHVAYSFYETDNRVMRYAETLAARGDFVDVVALRRPGQALHATVNGVNVYRIQRRTVNEKAPWVYVLKLASFFLKCFLFLSGRRLGTAYDVVHVHNIPDFLVLAAAIPKWWGTRVVLDIHDLVPELYAGKFGARKDSLRIRSLLFVERMACRFADHVLVANHLWRDRLTARSVPASKCTPMLNYPDLTLFRPLPRVRAPGDNRFLFLYPGTLNHHQGLDIAVAAFAIASPEMRDAEFHVYGDGPARQALSQQVRELGLQDRVRIMGRVPLVDVPQLMATVDVGVVPKRGDGFGNEAFSTKILEFMACGVPVIVSRTRVDAYYFPERLVRFFHPGSVDDLARSLVAAYHDGLRNADSTAAALEFAVAYGWQHHSGEYLQIVDGLATTCLSTASR